jgi:hypothetical protein
MAFNEKEVIKTIQDPARVDRKGTQFFAIKAIDALRVVYERKDYLSYNLLSSEALWCIRLSTMRKQMSSR